MEIIKTSLKLQTTVYVWKLAHKMAISSCMYSVQMIVFALKVINFFPWVYDLHAEAFV